MSSTIKQFFVVAAVLAIAFVFIIQFRPGTNVQTSGGPKCIAEVSGNCIEESDYLAAYRLMAPPNANSEDIKALRLPRMVVDGLIERWLLNQDAERLGIAVSDEELSRQLADGYARVSLPAAFEDFFAMRLALLPAPTGPARSLQLRESTGKKFDIKRYERTVRELTNKTPKDFREFERQEAVAARMRELVRSRVRISEAEAKGAFERERTKATVDYVKLERAWYASWVVDPGDEAVKAWAEQHKDEVEESWNARKDTFLPECRVTRNILARLDPEATDADAARKQATDKLEQAQKRLGAGESFDEVAQELSEDPGSRGRGGELGCIGKGRMPKAFDDAVFALEEGKTSGIIETGFGLQLVRVERVLKDDKAEAFGRQQVARDLYLKKEAERLAAEGAKQILAAAKAGKPLAEAVQAHVDEVLGEATKRAAKADKKAGKKARERKEKKGTEEGKQGEPEPGAEGREPSEPLTALTDPTRPRVQASLPFTANGPPFEGVQDPGEAARVMFELDKPGALPADVIKLYDGYAVAQLKEKTTPTDEDWTKERVRYLDGLRRDKQRDALSRYVQDLRQRYGKDVSYDRTLTEGEEGEGKKKEPKDQPKKK
jgi:peptidyl-prolyl cis-trans isomerase D